MTQTVFDVILLAGQDPDQPDPLAVANGVANKVLIPLVGRPMIEYVLQPLAGNPVIHHIVLIGFEAYKGVGTDTNLHCLPGDGSIFDNVMRGFSWLADRVPPAHHALVLTGDIPLITAAQINWFLHACQPLDKDVYWGIVEQTTMEKTFPASRRSYLPVVEGRFCNGGVYLVRIEAALGRQALIDQLIEQRKHILRQLWMLGPGVIVKFLLRRLRLADLVAVMERLLGVRGAVIILPFAETGMDVDKPHQLAQVRAYLEHNPRT
jgi:molybdopterin-guanine dinucleotide biosynthesis protein A